MSRPRADIVTSDEFQLRLLELIGSRSFSQFERECKLPRNSLRKYFDQEKLLRPGFDALVSIAMATGCSADWLLLGKGEPFTERKESK